MMAIFKVFVLVMVSYMIGVQNETKIHHRVKKMSPIVNNKHNGLDSPKKSHQKVFSGDNLRKNPPKFIHNLFLN